MGSLQPFWIAGGEVAVVQAGVSKFFNSFGFVALAVFAAVLLTSVTLSAPADRTPGAESYSLEQAHMTPSALRFEELNRRQPRRD